MKLKGNDIMNVTITLNQKMIEFIDKNRGDLSIAGFIRKSIKEASEQQKSSPIEWRHNDQSEQQQ